MRESRDETIARVFAACLERPPRERAAFLAAACPEDQDLLAEVMSLLASHDRAGNFLDELDRSRAAALLEAGPMPGHEETIGPYRLLRELGRGGMGVVWLAERADGQFDRKVALKLIKRGMDSDAIQRRFMRERQILARLQHPNIASLLDGGVLTDGQPWFAMEYVEGEPLTRYCDRRRLGLDERLGLFDEVSRAVQHAHRQLIVHRDLKPSNILVTGTGKVKLLDFGIAKLLESEGDIADPTLTAAGVRLVTPEYASPEQLRGEPVTTSTDVYALGVILYELLTGRRPFTMDRRGADAMARTVSETEAVRPSTVVLSPGDGLEPAALAEARHTTVPHLRRRLHGDLDWITLKALEKEPVRRYASPAELAADIRRHLADAPVEAGPPGAAYRMRKFVRRNKVMVGSLALVFAALAVGIAIATTFGVRESAQRRRADAALKDLEQVAEFQAEIISKVNAEEMGRRLLADLRAKGIEAQEKAGIAAGIGTAEARAFDRFTVRINTTDVALRAIDQEILKRAAEAMEDPFADQPLVRARLAHTIGRTYLELGLLDRAVPHVRRAVEIREKELGREHPDTLSSIETEALLRLRQAQYEKAEPLLLEVVGSSRRILGPEDPRTLSAMSNLAILYAETGRIAEADSLHTEVLSIRERTLGEDHEDTLTSMHNLAENLRLQGRDLEAEPLYVKVLEGRRKNLGNEHPHTVLTMTNLANHYASLGRYDLAESLATEALAVRRRVLGDEHPDTLASLAVLASVRLEGGKLADAEALYSEGLETTRRTLGHEHPSTLVIMNNLARVYAGTGRLDDAIRLDREALEARSRVLGPDHPDTLSSMSNLALDYYMAGRGEESVRLNLDVVERRRRVLGPDHPYTLLSLGNLAMAYQRLGRLGEAEPVLREVYETARSRFGLEDRRTLLPMGNLAELRLAQGDAVEAERLMSEAAVAVRKALPAGHVSTGVTLRKYGAALTALGRHEEAEGVLLEAYEIVSKAAGPGNVQTLKVARDLAILYDAWGQPEKAAPWRDKATPESAATSAR